jgi:hypothetical protein
VRHAPAAILPAILAFTLAAQAQPEQSAGGLPPPGAVVKGIGTGEGPAPRESWMLRFEPSVWYVAPSGRFKLPGMPEGADEIWAADLNLDSPRASPFLELHVRAEEWMFSLSGFAFSAGDRESTAEFSGFLGSHPFSEGDRLSSSLDFVSGQVQAAYRLPWRLGRPGEDFAGLVDVIGGIQFIDIDLNASAPSGSVSVDELWAMPMVGGKLTMDITRRFTIDVQTTFGYFTDGGNKSSFTWDIFPGFTYYPLENIGLQIGYRQFLYRLESGSSDSPFEWKGAMAGIYGGLSIRF